MKKLILLFILFLGTQIQLQAQNAQLNKQQTIDYISNLYTSTFSTPSGNKAKSVTLDGKVLVISLESGHILRNSLSKSDSLEIDIFSGSFYIGWKDKPKIDDAILWYIQAEDDAKRLKKALEHLIEILKTEKNTDPFGE